MIIDLDPKTGRSWINWTPKKLDKFIKAHRKATEAGKDRFTFEKFEFLTNFGYYLIQHLRERFGK